MSLAVPPGPKTSRKIRIVAPAVEGEIDFGDENRLISRLKMSLPGAVYELLELGYSLLTAIRREVSG